MQGINFNNLNSGAYSMQVNKLTIYFSWEESEEMGSFTEECYMYDKSPVNEMLLIMKIFQTKQVYGCVYI